MRYGYAASIGSFSVGLSQEGGIKWPIGAFLGLEQVTGHLTGVNVLPST